MRKALDDITRMLRSLFDTVRLQERVERVERGRRLHRLHDGSRLASKRSRVTDLVEPTKAAHDRIDGRHAAVERGCTHAWQDTLSVTRRYRARTHARPFASNTAIVYGPPRPMSEIMT